MRLLNSRTAAGVRGHWLIDRHELVKNASFHHSVLPLVFQCAPFRLRNDKTRYLSLERGKYSVKLGGFIGVGDPTYCELGRK